MLQSRVRRGEMDREITFIKKVVGTNSFNEDTEESWVLVDLNPTVFARVVDKQRPQGNEVVVADRIVAIQITIFTVEWRNDITVEGHRVVYNGRPYNIVNIIDTMGVRGTTIDVQAELIDNETWT